jgi:hypothetical protein
MRALIVVDVQNDFCPGGALAVPEGDAVVEPINVMAREAPFVVATRDWHPVDHGSFAVDAIVEKGQAIDREGYSGFDVTVHSGATRPVEVRPGDAERAVEELRAAGVEVVD